MSKALLTLTLSALLLITTGCTEKKKETKTAVKEKVVQEDTSLEDINTTEVSKNILPKPKLFKSTIELNTSHEEIVVESLEELEVEVFKTVQPNIIKEMQNIPECLENAETKEEAFACSQTLRELNKEIAIAMGDFSEEEPKGYDEDFTWNEETKVNMIKEIEAGTQAMQEMQTCMEVSKTPEELERCLKP